MAFRQALSGINAADADLKVIGNNVANASTVGFKQSRAEFADVYANAGEGTTATAIGSGVRLSAVTQQFDQGNIGFTDNKLDIAINGDGFFVLDDNGSRMYTRSGMFQVDRYGYVVNSSSQKLVVMKTDPTGVPNGDVSPLQLNNANVNPVATSDVDVGINLDSGDAIPAASTFDPDNPASFNFSTSMTMYDSLGVSHLATMYFVKRPEANNWDMHLFIDGKNSKGAEAPPYAGDILTFDGAGNIAAVNGQGIPPGTGKVVLPPFPTTTGSVPLNLTLNFNGPTPMTQFGGKFDVNALSQNGYTTGRLTSLDIDDEGVILARYSNGQARTLGIIGLATFANKQGLRQIGDSNWVQSHASGEPLIGKPGSGRLGLLQAGALEDSNVDLTGQLVKMIIAQRNYQANAQVVRTADAVTQSVINIR